MECSLLERHFEGRDIQYSSSYSLVTNCFCHFMLLKTVKMWQQTRHSHQLMSDITFLSIAEEAAKFLSVLRNNFDIVFTYAHIQLVLRVVLSTCRW